MLRVLIHTVTPILTIESSTDELSFAIDDGAAGVTAGDVVRREEANRHGAVCHGVNYRDQIPDGIHKET